MSTTALSLALMAFGAAQVAIAQEAAPLKYLQVDAQAYYVMGALGGDPAFGRLTSNAGIPAASSYDLNSQDADTLDGFGLSVAVRRLIDGDWYAGFGYSGFFLHSAQKLGDPTVDSNSVHANLIDRAFARLSIGNAAANGQVDFASDTIDIDQHAGDLLVGRQSQMSSWLGTRLQGGLRVAATNVDRQVVYQNLDPTNLDTANIKLNSNMIGAGPTLGAGAEVRLTPSLTLSGAASASLLASYFDLSRRDVYVNNPAGTAAIRDVDLSTIGVVPMFDASVGLTQHFGRFYLGAGYTVSAALGGVRTINVNGWDDVDGATAPYQITSNDTIIHGVYARGGMVFGGPEDATMSTSDGPAGDGATLDVDAHVYYVMGVLGGDPAFGRLTPNAGVPAAPSYDLKSQDADALDGFGVSVGIRRLAEGDWYAGVGYSGFFVDSAQSLGDPTVDSNSVHANLIDRALANIVLDTTTDDGQVDFASDTINIDQHTGDMVIGRQSQMTGWLGTRLQGGLRVAGTSVDRRVVYQNIGGGALLSATTDFTSDMIGAGPTLGAGAEVRLTPSLTLSGAASASLLASYFDLTRRDAQSAGVTTAIRDVDLKTIGVVPMFDASVGLTQQFGRFYLGAGYTVSAALGGVRTIAQNGWDDVNGATSAYQITSNDTIIHGVYARGGMVLGGPEGSTLSTSDALADGHATLDVDAQVYYVMGVLGGDPAFGRLTSNAGVPAAPSYDLKSQDADALDGLGVSVGIRRLAEGDWYAGIGYSGFFVDSTQKLGDPTVDSNSVHANLIDRVLANLVLDTTTDDGQVDFASDTINIDQHTGDMVIGRQSQMTGWLGAHLQGGLRVAATSVDRQVVYQNIGGGTLLSATTDFTSDMVGAGPTIGAGANVQITPHLTLSGAASASLLASYFDLTRRDAQSAGVTTAIRDVDLKTIGVVPMFDASVGLTQHFGRFYLGAGYTVSAALGGVRTIIVDGWDDVDGATAPYQISSNDTIIHGVYVRAGVKLGGAPK